MQTKTPEVGDRVKITKLPIGYPHRRFAGRIGKIRHVHNYGPDSPSFYSIQLDRGPRERREWVIPDMGSSMFQTI